MNRFIGILIQNNIFFIEICILEMSKILIKPRHTKSKMLVQFWIVQQGNRQNSHAIFSLKFATDMIYEPLLHQCFTLFYHINLYDYHLCIKINRIDFISCLYVKIFDDHGCAKFNWIHLFHIPKCIILWNVNFVHISAKTYDMVGYWFKTLLYLSN